LFLATSAGSATVVVGTSDQKPSSLSLPPIALVSFLEDFALIEEEEEDELVAVVAAAVAWSSTASRSKGDAIGKGVN
jgi:hypothetical protein